MPTPTRSAYTPEEVKARIHEKLATGPAKTSAIVETIYPGKSASQDNGSPTVEYSRVSSMLRAMRDRKEIDQVEPGNRSSGWKLRKKPTVSDLPDADEPSGKGGARRGAGRPPGSKNGKPAKRRVAIAASDGEDDLRVYLLREIRMKLDALERLL